MKRTQVNKVNNATSGGGKVLSVARLEMAKYRTKGSK